MPVLGNRLDISVNGAALSAAVGVHVTSVVVSQALSSPAVAEVELEQPADDLVDVFAVGHRLRLEANGAGLFDGEVVAIRFLAGGNGRRTLHARAADVLHRAQKTQSARIYESASAATLLRDLAGDVGLEFDGASEAPVLALLARTAETPFACAARVARESGLYFRADGSRLAVFSLAGDGEPVRLDFGKDLKEIAAGRSADAIRARSDGYGWSAAAAAPARGSAGPARQDEEEFDDGGLVAFPGLGQRVLVNIPAADDAIAKAAAQADMDRAAATGRHMRATAEGDPRLVPGRPVEIAGLPSGLGGRYVIATVAHRFGADTGYLTEFATAPPTSAPAAPPSVTLGVVADAKDPEARARLQIAFPAYPDLAAIWLPCLVHGGGSGGGLSARHRKGDTVAVLSPDADPTHGIVLGGLFAESCVKGLTHSDDGAAIAAAAAQRLVLAPEAELARIEGGAGSVFELGSGSARLTAATDLVIEAPGRKLTFRASAIDFVKG